MIHITAEEKPHKFGGDRLDMTIAVYWDVNNQFDIKIRPIQIYSVTPNKVSMALKENEVHTFSEAICSRIT